MSRRNRTIIVVGIAVVTASVASWLVYRAIQQIPDQAPVAAGRQTVLAARQIAAGEILGDADVRLMSWPADAMVPGGFERIEDVVGRGALMAIMPNEVVTDNRLAPRGSGSGLALLIPEGMLAMSIRVNDIIGVAGFVVPGSHVDIIATLEETSKTILSDIQVVATGTRDQGQAPVTGQPVQASVVTVLVTPEDAEKLTLAQDRGSLMLALRHPLAVGPTETGGARLSSLMSGAAPAQPRPTPPPGRPRVAPPPPPAPPPPYTVETFKGRERRVEEIQTGAGRGGGGGGLRW